MQNYFSHVSISECILQASEYMNYGYTVFMNFKGNMFNEQIKNTNQTDNKIYNNIMKLLVEAVSKKNLCF